MKKLFKENIKPISIILLATFIQTLLYTLSKIIQSKPTIIGNSIDNFIPFNIYFIIPYSIWYLLLFILPLVFYKKNKEDFSRYIIAYLITSIIADIIFIIYPTTIIRPEPTNENYILYFITNTIYLIDTPVLNCFPSLHCAVAFIWILFITEKNKYRLTTKITIILISLLIIASTLFIKQHVFIDVIGGIILAIISHIIAKHIPKVTQKVTQIL